MSARVFISYAHADETLLDRLHKHLAQLKREGAVEAWYDREISAGSRLEDAIFSELEHSDIFLACVSPDWIGSNYAYEREFSRALELEAAEKMIIVPVIFAPCDWLSTPLKQFMALPQDGKAITEFTNRDVAFLDVVTALRSLVSTRNSQTDGDAATTEDDEGTILPSQSGAPRYRIRREFDDLDKRDFVENAFKEIYEFFERSTSEISQIPQIECRLSDLGADTFSCTLINRGVQRGFETLHVRMGGSWGAIDILYGEQNERNTSHGGFGVASDEYQLFLHSGVMGFSWDDDTMLSPREAAKKLWDELLSKVGIDYA